jgi:cytochrome c551
VSRNDVILGVAALVLVVFSLVVSLVIPRRDPGFPGRNIRVFTVVAVLLVVAMLAAVEVFGEAHESEGAEHTESGATDTGQQGDDGGGGGGGGGGGDAAAGEEIFVANCGSCHTLEEAGTTGNIGPNLDDSSFDQGAVEEQVAQGGGGMPPFEGQLSEEEIQNVAAFVVASEDG